MKASNAGAKRFATTFGTGFKDERFAQAAERIEVPPRLDRIPRRKFHALDEIRLFLRVVRVAARHKALLLYSSRGYLKPELLAIAFIGLWPARLRPAIVLYGEMFEPTMGLRGNFERLLVKLADRAIVRYMVYSTAELEVFPHIWDVNKEKVRTCPFYALEAKLAKVQSTRETRNHVFAGGNSFRNYETLLEAARRMPEQRFRICTTRLGEQNNLPDNVDAEWVSYEEYIEYMQTAAAVVIPLQMGLRRTAGLLTCLEALWLGKPTIVTDALGVRDYVQDEKTGLVVDGTPESYVRAIQWMKDPANKQTIQKMVSEGHRTVVEQFTLENHITRLLEVMEEAIATNEE